MNHISEYFAGCLVPSWRTHARQIGGILAFSPGAQSTRPGLDLFRRIGGRCRVLAALQPRINEFAGRIGNVGILHVVGVNDRHAKFAQQRDEFSVAEAVVADLDDVAQLMPRELSRQQFEERAEIARLEFFGRSELPQ